MSEFWFDHLCQTLSLNGVVAYMWDAGEDHYRWAGDLYGFFGLNAEDCPANNAQFHHMMNPQEVPARLNALRGVLNNGAVPATPAASVFKIRRANGVFIEVEESLTLQQNGAAGGKVICGFLKRRENIPAASPVIQPEKNIVPLGAEQNFGSMGRRALQQKMEEWFETAAIAPRAFGYLLAVGIDRMALFNDVLGPRYADELLEKTGERLRQVAGDSGYVVRLDGDVYGLLFRNAPGNEMAAVAKHILTNFHSYPVQTTMGPMGVGVSIGGVTLDKVKKNPAAAITMAEMALHAAKDKGRSCFVSHDEAAHQAADNHLLLKSANTFLKALKENRLHLAFQPIMRSETNAVSFHECLIRMQDETGKLISAGAFVPTIERLGLSRLVDQYALRLAIHELAMFTDVTLSVNVSNLSLTDHDWLRNVVSALRDRPSVAQRLIVEITESAVIADPERTKRVVRTLQDLGCRVALDDFGAGYTAFSQLKDLRVDLVKIDKSFIRNIGDEHNHLFVKTLKSLAQGVNVETVGEGAETLAEAKLLASDGIDHIQGYVFGFPQVERVWLPKEHVHRRVPLDTGPNHMVREETLEDIARWNRR